MIKAISRLKVINTPQKGDLRWIETDDGSTLPVASIPGYPEDGPSFYKLQIFNGTQWKSVAVAYQTT